MTNMNICLMNDSFPPAIDGVANTITNYARVISSGMGRAAVVTPYYPDADDSRFAYPVYRYPSLDTTPLVGYRAGLPFSPELMGELERADFDLIHTHCPFSSAIVARLLRERTGKPLVFTYHTKYDIDISNAIRGKLLRQEALHLIADNIAACDEVWTVSRGAGENLRSIGYDGEYVIMRNGVDIPKGRVSEAMIEKAAGGIDLPDGLPVFLFVGRLMWYKGIDIILDALSFLRRFGTDYRMVFIGGGGDREEIVKRCSELRLNDRVFFLPPEHDRERLRAWYCRADVFLFPSTFDTNGLVVREAAACALPSVLVAGSCAAEDVEDGKNGFLMENNAYAMASLLEKLCRRPELIKEAGKCAQDTLYISWDEAVKAAGERYGLVIEKHRRGLYPKHGTLRDDFFHVAAKTLDNMNVLRTQADELRTKRGRS